MSFDFELAGTQMLADGPSLTVSRAGAAVMLFSWPASGNFILYTATNLAPPLVWDRVTNAPALSNGQWFVPLPITSDECRFYRLRAE